MMPARENSAPFPSACLERAAARLRLAMTGARLRSVVAAVVVSVSLSVSAAHAQTSAPISRSQPDCQTVLQCNFRRGGVYRGCISAYTCRTCRLVRSRDCSISGSRGNVCRRLVCSWG